MIWFGIIRFGSVNDTEASVFGYSVFTRFVRPLLGRHTEWVKNELIFAPFFRILKIKGVFSHCSLSNEGRVS